MAQGPGERQAPWRNVECPLCHSSPDPLPSSPELLVSNVRVPTHCPSSWNRAKSLCCAGWGQGLWGGKAWATAPALSLHPSGCAADCWGAAGGQGGRGWCGVSVRRPGQGAALRGTAWRREYMEAWGRAALPRVGPGWRAAWGQVTSSQQEPPNHWALTHLCLRDARAHRAVVPSLGPSGWDGGPQALAARRGPRWRPQ